LRDVHLQVYVFVQAFHIQLGHWQWLLLIVGGTGRQQSNNEYKK
jgi:hypothetical protein